MTAQADNTAPNNKEINFRAQEKAMKDHYERQLAQERSERERLVAELENAKKMTVVDDDDDSEPYVDKKKLVKTLDKFGKQHQQQTQSDIQNAVQMALKEERKKNWLEKHSDFDKILEGADKLYEADPELAETILAMPPSFERQKLVYKNIKALGLDKEKQREPSIQEQIDAKKRGQYYQPSGLGSAPYAGVTSDFSQSGQKSAYEKMKNLIGNVRLS